MTTTRTNQNGTKHTKRKHMIFFVIFVPTMFAFRAFRGAVSS